MTATAALKPKTADLSRFRALVAEDLKRVNEVILTHGQSDVALINDLASHIIAAGGKRLRPCLTIACTKLCGYVGDRHIRLAACVEFIHTATLLHDDVVDESALRRGEATANAVWGNKSSVLVGDFLLSRSFQLMVADGSLDVLTILSDASAIVAAGEVHQMMISHDLSITQDIYEQVVSAKTAALFAAACEVGPLIAGSGKEAIAACRSYGTNLGVAFQLMDDVLDYGGTTAKLGKNVGDDFREGKITLPVVLAYRRGDSAERSFWKGAMEEGLNDNRALDRAIGLHRKHRSLEDTVERARHYGTMAKDALGIFPASPLRAAEPAKLPAPQAAKAAQLPSPVASGPSPRAAEPAKLPAPQAAMKPTAGAKASPPGK
jgi:octaprenyl-diphosphate synthase